MEIGVVGKVFSDIGGSTTLGFAIDDAAFAGMVSADLITASALPPAFVGVEDAVTVAAWVGAAASTVGAFADATDVVVDGQR